MNKHLPDSTRQTDAVQVAQNPDLQDFRQQKLAPKWTAAQQEAIHTTGSDILVTAAAGSGKTAVLVQRIVERVLAPGHQVDIDRLLVMTFTNAAAAEMRERVGAALSTAMEQQPDSQHLRRQFSLLNKAQISTIHAFCMEVLRSHFYKLDIDPGFRIANETERSLILDEAIERLLEDEYSQEENELFLQVVNTFSSDRSDFAFTQMLEKLMTSALSHPDPSAWLDNLAVPYNISAEATINDLEIYPFLLNEIDFVVKGVLERLHYARHLCTQPAGPLLLIDTIDNDMERVKQFHQHVKSDWSLARDFAQIGLFQRAPSMPMGSCDPVLKDRVARLREHAKKNLQMTIDSYFAHTPEIYLQDIRAMAPVVGKLAELVKKLLQIFAEKKKGKNLVDFNDLEHFTLAVLTEDVNDERIPSEIAKEYQRRFEEVLVDEYQDTNNVQETILQCIKHPAHLDGNLFMVGDVKQSIYRFRLADPSLFSSKYEQYKQGDGQGVLISLNKNFRSRKEIIDGTNYIFQRLMNEQIGEIDYDEDVSLHFSATYPDSNQSHPIELHLLDQKKLNEQGEFQDQDEFAVAHNEMESETEELTASRFEAREMAQSILQMIEAGTVLYDQKLQAYRPMTYRDIVVLYRSKSWYADCVDEFSKLAVPIYAEMNEGYFDTTEISVMLSLLKIIDNPYQDIPLVAVLRSPLVGLTADQLAEIRLVLAKEPYYEALKLARGSQQVNESLRGKIDKFLCQLQHWTSESKHLSVAKLIWLIYRETNYLEFVGGLPRGKQRQANIMGLYYRANEFENSAFRGIFRFLRFVERLRERGDDLGEVASIGEQENVVRMMSIHASKGLEFPIVLIGGLARQFNKIDLRSSYILDKDFGLAVKFTDPDKRITRDTLFRGALLNKKLLESISEEMRVLYVAMTRAKEKLLLFATTKNLEKNVQRWAIHQQNKKWLLSDNVRAMANCYLDWLGPSLVSHEAAKNLLSTGFEVNYDDGIFVKGLTDHPSKWTILQKKQSNVQGNPASPSSENAELLQYVQHFERVPIQSEWQEEIRAQMNWKYSFEPATKFKAKQSVTEIKRMSMEADELAGDEWLPAVADDDIVQSEPKAIVKMTETSDLILVDQQLELDFDAVETSKKYATELPRPKFLLEKAHSIVSQVEAGEQSELDAGVSSTVSQAVEAGEQSELDAGVTSTVSQPVEHSPKISPAERGTLMHLVMEHIDLSVDITFEQITDKLDELVRKEYLSEAERKVINRGQVLKFYQSEIGGRVRTATKVWREVPFSMKVWASKVYPDWRGDDEAILVQGVIDCMFLTDNDEIVLVDYKTDKIHQGFAAERSELAHRYQKQIDLYTEAIEGITRRKVAERYLYFFDDGGNAMQL